MHLDTASLQYEELHRIMGVNKIRLHYHTRSTQEQLQQFQHKGGKGKNSMINKFFFS